LLELLEVWFISNSSHLCLNSFRLILNNNFQILPSMALTGHYVDLS
jgi:hypothetical protein